MKKKIISLILTATIILSTSSISTSAIEIERNNSTLHNAVEDVLKSYFDANLESEKQLQSLKNESIVPDSSLETLTELQYELKAKVNSKYNQKLDSYSTNIEINSISYEGDLIKVNANNKVTCKYSSCEDNSFYTESHVLYLKEIDNNLLVEKDILSLEGNAANVENSIKKDFSNNITRSSNEDFYESYIENQLDMLKDKLDNTDKYFSEPSGENLNNQRHTPRLNGLIYNGTGAANWALNNVYSKEDYEGNDCTNFVSKALCFGGGMKQDFRYNWYQGSMRWIRVNELYEYLSPITGYCSNYYPNWYAVPGDVIQLYNKNKQTFSHSLIVTKKVGSGNVYVSAHSNAALNVPLTNYLTNGIYSDDRLLSFIVS